jgi:hypothetical protein
MKIYDCSLFRNDLDLRLLQDINFEKYQPFIIEIEPSDGFAPGTSNASKDHAWNSMLQQQGKTI